MSEPNQEVQLQGQALEEARAAAAQVERGLLAFADLTLTHLYGAGHGHRCKAIKIFPKNTRIAIYDERLHLIGVWENPPGVCRRPRKGEKFD